jgi:serine/threonine-protein kinase
MREAAADGEDVEKVRTELIAAERVAASARQAADSASRQGTEDTTIYERAGAAAATAQAKREQLARYEGKKNAREATARDLRRQIDELRNQLARYAEALDAELTQGREKVGARTREGLGFEKQFGDVTTTMLQHLRNKAECRDLMQEFLNTSGTGPQPLESIEPKGPGGGPISRA